MSKVVAIRNRKTSVNLEDQFWSSLRKIATTQSMRIRDIMVKIDNELIHRKPVLGHPAYSSWFTIGRVNKSRYTMAALEQAGRPRLIRC